MTLRIFLLVLAISGAQTAAAEIYKYVDQNGVVRYTDKPPNKNAQPLNLPPVQTYGGGDSSSGQAADAYQGGVNIQPVATVTYSGVEMLMPTPDQVFTTATPVVTAFANVSPSLQQGHQVVFLVDGLPVQVPYGQANIDLPGLGRGTHTVQAVVMDNSNSIQAQSNPVTFHIRPPSVLRPAGPTQFPKAP